MSRKVFFAIGVIVATLGACKQRSFNDSGSSSSVSTNVTEDVPGYDALDPKADSDLELSK